MNNNISDQKFKKIQRIKGFMILPIVIPLMIVAVILERLSDSFLFPVYLIHLLIDEKKDLESDFTSFLKELKS